MTRIDVEVSNLSYAFAHTTDHQESLRILHALLALITDGEEAGR